MTKSWLSILALGAAAVECAAAAEPRVVRMPIQRVANRSPGLRKRASNSQAVTIYNADYFYYVNATVGTPGQPVTLLLDTGSSDIWMFGNQVCSSQGGQELCESGYFDPSKSSTYKSEESLGQFKIQYVTPGSGVSGDYFEDDFDVQGVHLTGLTMAVASYAQAVNTGIMGIGYDTDESIVASGASGTGSSSPYPNIIDVMVTENVIASHSYSLYLDDLNADSGSILFGGYDTSKYSDPLTVLDIQPDSMTDAIDTFAVAWSFVGVTTADGKTTLVAQDSFPVAAVLDSGTSLTVVPQSVFDELSGFFNATYEGQNYGYIVPCSNANTTGTLDFGFGGANGAIIQVPFSELAIPQFDEEGNPLTFEDGTLACSFGLDVTQEDSPVLLGDTFLRSAYVIYDLEANQVAIAQAKYGANGSPSVQEIPAGTNLASILGSAATAATGAAVTQTASGQVAAGFGGTETGSVAATGQPSGGTALNGQQTTLNVGTNTNIGSNTQSANPSASTSKKNDASAIPSPPPMKSIFMWSATVFALFASGASMMLFF